jgi:hypothetical protein
MDGCDGDAEGDAERVAAMDGCDGDAEGDAGVVAAMDGCDGDTEGDAGVVAAMDGCDGDAEEGSLFEVRLGEAGAFFLGVGAFFSEGFFSAACFFSSSGLT